MGTLRGRNCRRGRNIAHGLEAGLLGDGEGWGFFTGIGKCHQHAAPKLGSRAVQQRTSIAWLESPSLPRGDGSDSAGTPSFLLHRGTPVRTSSTSSHPLLLPPGWSPWPRAVGTGWARPPELQASRWRAGRKGFAMSASVLLGQEQTTPEQEGFAPWLALGVPRVSCILLPRRGKSLLPQGRGQGSWKRSCGSIHLTLVLQQRCQRCPTARVPAGLSPAWAHPGAVASDGEAVAGTARGCGAISKPHARVFPGAFPQPSASPEAGARGARRRGCKQLRVGATLSVYSKTSHVPNEEQGDKETPRAAHLPARYP